MAKAKVTKIDLQNGTTRTVFATWTWDKKSQTKEYDIRWYYATGDGVRFIGSEEKKTITNATLQSTYTAPENAKLVKFQVKPIAKTRKVNKKDVAYWTAQWSTEVQYNFKNNPPETPPVPTVTIKDYTLTAKINYLEGTACEGLRIQFQVVKDDRVYDDTPYKSGTVKAYTHQATYTTSVDPGHVYKVRCRATQDGMNSKWTEYTTNVGTIPGSPTINSYSGASDTSVYISWSGAGESDSYSIEYATEESYLGASNNSTTIDNIKSLQYTITGLESGKVYYIRVKAVNSQGDSGWSNVVSVVIGKEPAAPTTWSSTTTAIVGEKIILYWVHNAEDGSAQRYAELEVIIDGAEYTYDIKNEDYEDEDKKDKTSQYVLDTTDGAKYRDGAVIQWRVRTAGISMTYGDWSIQRTINVYAPATLDLQLTNKSGSGISTLTSFPLYVKGTAGPSSQIPIGYYVSIVANDSYSTVDETGSIKIISKGDEVYSKFYDVSQELVLEISAGSMDLENNVTYTVNCMVTMDTGLSTQESRDFTVAWQDEEYEVNAEIGYDPETLTAYLNPYCEDANGNRPSGVTLSVYRRQYDGGFVELASGLSNNENVFVTDPHPSLDYARYRIVSISDATGAVSDYDLPGYPVGEIAVIIQWDEQWSSFNDLGEDAQESPIWGGSVLRLPYNIDISDNSQSDVTLVKYIGRSRPVSYYGTQIDSSATWNVEIPKNDKETLYGLRRLANWTGDVYVREPSGSGYWANVSVSFSQTHCELTIPVTLSLTRVEGGI